MKPEQEGKHQLVCKEQMGFPLLHRPVSDNHSSLHFVSLIAQMPKLYLKFF